MLYEQHKYAENLDMTDSAQNSLAAAKEKNGKRNVQNSFVRTLQRRENSASSERTVAATNELDPLTLCRLLS